MYPRASLWENRELCKRNENTERSQRPDGYKKYATKRLLGVNKLN